MIKRISGVALRTLVRSRPLARTLFGIDFGPTGSDDYYFDVTTVVLYRRMLRVLQPGSQILDMGTGPMAVLGLALRKARGCRVVASDVNPDLVELARQNVRRNGADVTVILSRYLAGVPADVDTVLFNPPYVPTSTGVGRGLSNLRRSQWDGGPTGAEVIEGYFAEVQALDRPVTTHVGINHRHLPREAVLALLDRFPGLVLEESYRHPLLPVDVHTVKNGAAARPPGPS